MGVGTKIRILCQLELIDLYVILAMPFNSFLVVVIYIIEIPSFYFGNAT